jgi:DNA-binding LacI/PurR family transcriptional regulator
MRQPAMTDVARLAGVSHQTVSRVLNDHPSVREETRLRVRAAIEQLGYRPNSAARALVTGRSRVVGVVTQSSTLFGPGSLLTAIEQAAGLAGFAVTVASVRTLERDAVAEAVGRHLNQGVAGIVLITPVASAGPAIEDVPSDVPLVAIDGDPERSSTLVTVDQEAGARMATRHLLEAGHATVWHVSGPTDWFDARGRIAGWRSELVQAGAEVPPLLSGDWSAAAGYRAGQMLARMSEVTAVFAANDQMALGILRALNERERHVPEDISLVGFDDIPEAAYYSPPLTTIRPDFAAVAQSGLELLLEQMGSDRPKHRRHTVSPRLVIRDSVAPPLSGKPRAVTS